MLIVEDEETLKESLKRLFQREGFFVDAAASAEEGLAMAKDGPYDVIVSDIILPGMDGIEMMGFIREYSPDQAFIVMTAYASLETAVKALRAGAFDYIIKPIMHNEIKQVVRNAVTQQALRRENALLKKQYVPAADYSSIIGRDPALLGVIDEVRMVADSRSNVLLYGETGTGKELFARVIHGASQRRDMQFLPINCSAIPETLLESELFGHIKGAFTGALSTKLGLLEEADGGTVFLDEIGDIPLSIQVKLLRILEDQEIRSVGSTKSRKINIRLITATNRDLKEAVATGRFREDLYYRINVIGLRLPPLRERRDDIPALALHFVAKFAAEGGRPPKRLSPEAMQAMRAYAWPGNIRELQNVIERATLISGGEEITLEHLPVGMRAREEALSELSLERELSIDEYARTFVQGFQARYSEQELADRLGITRKTLWEKRRKWGLLRRQTQGAPEERQP